MNFYFKIVGENFTEVPKLIVSEKCIKKWNLELHKKE